MSQVRRAYKKPWKHVGFPALYSFCLQAAIRRIEPFKCFKAIFALKMTFDPISYVYIPTALRFKSTQSGHRTTKNGGTACKRDELMQSSAPMLDSLQPPVAEHADGDGDDELRIEGEFGF